MKLLRLSITVNFTKDERIYNISQLGGYDAPLCEQQYTHGSCYIFLFKFKLFDQLISPKLPQILDIYSVVTLYTLSRRIHYVKFLAFHGNQLEYNGSQGANGAG